MELLNEWIAKPWVVRILKLVVYLFLVTMLVRLAKAGAGGSIKDTDARYRVRKVLTFAGYGAGALVMLSTFSGQLGGFTVVLGAASVGIGFALQEVIVSIAGWLAISFGNFYKPGDRVQLGGILGDVIDIGVLRTTLMECGGWVRGDLYNGRIVRVANSYVFKEPVFSYSGDFPFLWDEITVPIKYGTDHREARAILNRIASDLLSQYASDAKSSWEKLVSQYRTEDARVDPMVTVVANDNWIELTLRYIVDYRARRATKDMIFTRLLDEIDASNGRVGLASATFHLVEAPTLQVRIEPPLPSPSREST